MEPIFPANPEERVGFYGGRITEGLWGEPLNLASDLCLVAYIVYFFLKLKREGFADTPVLTLVALGGLVGLGSLIFHGHPNKVTLQIDLIPITIFGLAYTFFSMRRFLQQPLIRSTLYTILFLLFSMAFESATRPIRVPGIHHIPSILMLVLIGTICLRKGSDSKVGRGLLMAVGFYIAALFFRTLDLVVFRSFPLGLHFLWHICTACVIGLLLHTAASHKDSSQKPTV